MTNRHYDVVVIGAGPAGYVGAIRCAQLGLKTACVDQWTSENGSGSLGGTCLNVGCIPSKALLDSSHFYHHITHGAKAHGIDVGEVHIDVSAMQRRKQKIVSTLTRGIEGLFKKNKVEPFYGTGRLAGTGRVTVAPADNANAPIELEAERIVIATGSVPMQIASAPVDGDKLVDSTGALAFQAVPKRLGVIGAGVIGLELGSVWARLGAEVVILEALETFLPMVDLDIAKDAYRSLAKQDLDMKLGCKVIGSRVTDNGVQVDYENAEGPHELGVDKLIVAVGRRPNTEGLGAEEAGLKLDERGFIDVNGHFETNLEGVYAIGDVIGGPMLAHKGSQEGIAVAERIAGQAAHINYDTVPWIIYTWPEIAWVGKTEQALKAEGAGYRVGTFPFMAIGRARAMGEAEGKVKIIGDARTDRILGVHILGPQASELIAEAVFAMECDASTEDLARTIHAHPTLAEAMHEAALAVDKRAIHI